LRIWRQRWPSGFTVTDANVLLCMDAQGFCDRVLTLLPGVALNGNELGSLTSFVFNIGADAFAGSTVRQRLIRGERQGAADALRMWTRAAGVTLPGLIRRREAERALFLKPIGG
jgi:lysozyme